MSGVKELTREEALDDLFDGVARILIDRARVEMVKADGVIDAYLFFTDGTAYGEPTTMPTIMGGDKVSTIVMLRGYPDQSSESFARVSATALDPSALQRVLKERVHVGYNSRNRASLPLFADARRTELPGTSVGYDPGLLTDLIDRSVQQMNG